MSPSILILNPVAAGGRDRELIVDWAKSQSDIELRLTTKQDDAATLAKQACDANPPRLIVAGGDGTIHQAVCGMMTATHLPRLAVLPTGTANDYARSLGITDLDTAFTALKENNTTRVDLARFNSGCDRSTSMLVNAATAGLSVAISDEMDDTTKAFWGRFCYATTAAQRLADAPTYELTVKTDDDVIHDSASAVMIGNGGCAGGVCLIPNAAVDDGLLDVVVVRATTGSELLRVLALFALGRQLDDELVQHIRTKRVRIESDPDLAFSVDGEPIGTSPIEMEIVPAALEVIIHRDR